MNQNDDKKDSLVAVAPSGSDFTLYDALLIALETQGEAMCDIEETNFSGDLAVRLADVSPGCMFWTKNWVYQTDFPEAFSSPYIRTTPRSLKVLQDHQAVLKEADSWLHGGGTAVSALPMNSLRAELLSALSTLPVSSEVH